MSKFKKGDRVIVKKCSDNALVIGKAGTVIGVDGKTGIDAVEFDDYVGGHNALPAYDGRNGHCWFLTEKELKPASKFEAGQVYRARADGSIIKITSTKKIAGCYYGCYYVAYETIRAKRNEVGSFLSTSLFAKRLEPLVGPQIGEAIKEYDAGPTTGKHAYSDSEIAEAKAFVLDTIRDLAEKGTYASFGTDKYGSCTALVSGKDTKAKVYGNYAEIYQFETGKSKCSPNDEPNPWIGKAVALCRALERPIPNYVR